MKEQKKYRLYTTGEFGCMNPIQQILHRWGGANLQRIAHLCEVTVETVDLWYRGQNIPQPKAIAGISIVTGFPYKRLLDIQQEASKKRQIEGSLKPVSFSTIKQAVLHLTDVQMCDLVDHYTENRHKK